MVIAKDYDRISNKHVFGGLCMKTTAIILAGGTGQRMKTNGLPKQFLSLFGKPIICFTIEKFENCPDVDQIVIPCNSEWIDHMRKLVDRFNFKKVIAVIPGGKDRQESVTKGLSVLDDPSDEDIVLIHDGVRPLVMPEIISENIRVARENGNAMTVKQNIETVVVTEKDTADFEDFKNRDNTYVLTAPQTFRVNELLEVYNQCEGVEPNGVPLLDASLMYAYLGKKVFLVKETGLNLKITTPEDFYYLRSYLELQENKNIFGV